MKVRVIGGGPAGSASAIRLAREGCQVTLYEKSVFPRPKLCGGFISGESLPELAEIGVGDAFEERGAWPIHRLVLSAASGAQVTVPLPKPAWGISRQTLDAFLLEHTQACGVSVHQADGFQVTEKTDWTVIATGRHLSRKPLLPRNVGEGWDEGTSPSPSPRPSPAFRGRGSKALYGIQSTLADVQGITDQVELNLFNGGYVGLNRHEDGNTNICALLDPEFVRRLGPDLDDVLKGLIKNHAGLRERLAKARRLQPWLAVGPVDMGLHSLTKERTFYVGDAACVVDPFAGEGLTMAFLTAHLMTDALMKNPAIATTLYEQTWHQAFDKPLRLQSILRGLTRSSVLQEALVRGTSIFPALLEWLTEKTRAPMLTSL